jgi:hypothetical protein
MSVYTSETQLLKTIFGAKKVLSPHVNQIILGVQSFFELEDAKSLSFILYDFHKPPLDLHSSK